MLDHVSITVSDLAAAERFYDAIMKALDVVKVGRSDRWLGYGERADAQHPDRVYIAIYKGAKPDEATKVAKRGGRVLARRYRRRWHERIPARSRREQDRSGLPSRGLKRFPAKWSPVRVKKTRQTRNLDPR